MQIVSALRGVGEAVKGKNEKWLTGVRYAHARDGTLHPRGGDDPPAERKKRGRTTKKLGGGDGKRATFRSLRRGGNKGGGARRVIARRYKKKWAAGGGIAEDFVTLPLQTGRAPRSADLRSRRRDRRPAATRNHPPRLCHLETAVRPTSPRL